MRNTTRHAQRGSQLQNEISPTPTAPREIHEHTRIPAVVFCRHARYSGGCLSASTCAVFGDVPSTRGKPEGIGSSLSCTIAVPPRLTPYDSAVWVAEELL